MYLIYASYTMYKTLSTTNIDRLYTLYYANGVPALAGAVTMQIVKGVKVMTVTEVAKALKAHPAAIRRDIRKGFVPTRKKTKYEGGNGYQIIVEDYIARLAEKGFDEDAAKLRAALQTSIKEAKSGTNAGQPLALVP